MVRKGNRVLRHSIQGERSCVSSANAGFQVKAARYEDNGLEGEEA